MNKHFLLPALFILFLTPAFATTNICDVSVDPDRVASFANGENVTVTLSYQTDEAAGIRIFARPFSNGHLTPAYSASGSPLYTGAGTATGTFTITAGSPIVDEIRVEVYASDNTTLLRRFWIPVRFRFGETGVNHFTFSSDRSLTSLLLGENFTTSFQYNITYPGGVRVFIRPVTDGALTPGYSASGSGVYTGTGAMNANVSITAGVDVHVDSLRVKIVSADQSVDIDEFYIPVNLHFSTVKITDITPTGGNFPYNNDNREVDFNYSTTEAGGIRIFVRPITNGALTPNYSASGSPLYTGAGSANATFTITATDQRVDHARFRVTNPDQSQVLLQLYQPVEYTFGNFLADNELLCPASPAHLENGERVVIRWDYYNDEGQDTRVFVRPYTNGALTPGYAASGSPVYATGSGAANDFFTITAGNVIVDQLHFQVVSSDQSTTFAEYFLPVHYEFGNASVPTHAPETVVDAMSVFPNPAMDQGNMTLLLRASGQAHVYLTDMSGRLVADLGSRLVTAQSPETFHWNSNGLLPGAYFVVAEGDGFRQTEKWVVLR